MELCSLSPVARLVCDPTVVLPWAHCCHPHMSSGAITCGICEELLAIEVLEFLLGPGLTLFDLVRNSSWESCCRTDAVTWVSVDL